MQLPAMFWPCVAIILVVGLYAAEKGAGYLIFSVVPVAWLLISSLQSQYALVKKVALNRLGFPEVAARIPSTQSAAFIARSLTRKLKPVLADGDTLVLVGGDGHAICASEPHPILRYKKRPYPWRQHVEQMLLNGCHIIQYVVNPTAAALAAFRELELGQLKHLNAENGAAERLGSFEIRKLGLPRGTDDVEGRRLIRGLATQHPSFAMSADGSRKMLWLERYHAPLSTTAIGCEYYSPDDLRVDPEPFDRFGRVVARAWALTQGKKLSDLDDQSLRDSDWATANSGTAR